MKDYPNLSSLMDFPLLENDRNCFRNSTSTTSGKPKNILDRNSSRVNQHLENSLNWAVDATIAFREVLETNPELLLGDLNQSFVIPRCEMGAYPDNGGHSNERWTQFQSRVTTPVEMSCMGWLEKKMAAGENPWYWRRTHRSMGWVVFWLWFFPVTV